MTLNEIEDGKRYIMVFCPTRYPGFDVTYHSLKRQVVNDDIKLVLCVADEFAPLRGNDLAEKFEDIGIDYVSFKMSKQKGYKRNLAASYKQAMEFARTIDADGFVTLQDYIWIPEDGIQRFIDVSDSLENPYHLLTGICHISSDPEPDLVVNPDDYFSIFEEPYDGKPEAFWWTDVRLANNGGPGQIKQTFPVEWEANWGYIPRKALYDKRLVYDEDFDKYVAYENQDYAMQATERGYEVIIDTDNVSISLPHKQYWPSDEEEEAPLTLYNQNLLQVKHDI